MIRPLSGIALLLFVIAPLRAQDMPLSQILIDGEGWKGAFKLPERAVQGTPSKVSYFSVPDEHSVYRAGLDGKKQVVAQDLGNPSCLVLWPDGGTLVVGDARSKYLWTFRVEADGRLTARERYYTLRVRPGQTASEVAGLTVDSAGRLYATTNLGVQVFDPTGRLCGVLLKPAEDSLAEIAFGGPGGDTLYIRCGGQVYARKLRAKSADSTQKPAR